MRHDASIVAEADAVARDARRGFDVDDERRLVTRRQLEEIDIRPCARDEAALLVEQKNHGSQSVHRRARHRIANEAGHCQPRTSAFVTHRYEFEGARAVGGAQRRRAGAIAKYGPVAADQHQSEEHDRGNCQTALTSTVGWCGDAAPEEAFAHRLAGARRFDGHWLGRDLVRFGAWRRRSSCTERGDARRSPGRRSGGSDSNRLGFKLLERRRGRRFLAGQTEVGGCRR